MCSAFSLLVLEWKLCTHTASDVQTSKLAQRYTILACCWYHWCEYCRFVIFQLFSLKYLMTSSSDVYSFATSMCSTFSLLVIEWKLCAHTTSNVQTSKRAQCYTILACCWYQWCDYCRFVIFQLFFLKYLMQAQKAILTSVFERRCVFYSLSFGYRVETVRTHYKRRTNIKTYTTLYYISVLLVSLV